MRKPDATIADDLRYNARMWGLDDHGDPNANGKIWTRAADEIDRLRAELAEANRWRSRFMSEVAARYQAERRCLGALCPLAEEERWSAYLTAQDRPGAEEGRA